MNGCANYREDDTYRTKVIAIKQIKESDILTLRGHSLLSIGFSPLMNINVLMMYRENQALKTEVIV